MFINLLAKMSYSYFLLLTLESEVKTTVPLERTTGWRSLRIQETRRSRRLPTPHSSSAPRLSGGGSVATGAVLVPAAATHTAAWTSEKSPRSHLRVLLKLV